MMSRPSHTIMLAALSVSAMLATGCTERTAASSTTRDPYSTVDTAETHRALDRAQNEAVMWKSRYEALEKRMAEMHGSGEATGTIQELALGEGMTRSGRGGAALSDDFAFAKGSADLNAEGKRAIAALATQLKATTGRIVIEGHTDATPVSRASTKEKFVDNWGLSAARAAAVARALAEAGIDASRLFPVGRAHSAPLGGDKAKDRRVEIYVGQ